MARVCDVCQTSYEPVRVTSKYCSTRCRTRATRAGLSSPKTTSNGSQIVQLPAAAASASDSLPHGAEQMAVRELEQVDRLNTVLGQAAVVLARRLDSSHRETGSAAAALARQLEATMKSATAGVKSTGSALDRARDELAARRARGA